MFFLANFITWFFIVIFCYTFLSVFFYVLCCEKGASFKV